MSKDFQKQVIEFNTDAFKEATIKHSKNLEVSNEIIKEVKSLLKTNSIDEKELFKDVLSYVYSELKVIYKDKILIELSGKKIAELLELDLSKLQNLINSYKDIKAPIQDDFCIATSNEIENERLKVAKKVVVMLNELQEFTELKSLLVQRGLNNCITYDNHKQMFMPNWYFIKTTL
jgi:hypothetical protein